MKILDDADSIVILIIVYIVGIVVGVIIGADAKDTIVSDKEIKPIIKVEYKIIDRNKVNDTTFYYKKN